MPPIGPILALLGKFWPFIGIGVLVLAVGVQSARLNHAKADQFDRRVCVAGHACHPTKWEAEAKADEKDIAHLSAQVNADAISIGNLQRAINEQNASIDAAKAQGEARTAAASQAVAMAHRATQAAENRADAILATKAGADACQSADDVILGSIRP